MIAAETAAARRVASSGRWFRHQTRVILAAITLAGLALRWEYARFGLPYLHHWDEPFIANRALHILQSGDYDPHFFNYGSLIIYLDTVVDAAHFLAVSAVDPGSRPPLSSPADVRFHGARTDRLTNAPEQPFWFVSHPSFYLWNRRLTGLFGAAAILLAFAVARRLAGAEKGALAGLVAAFVLATNGFHVEQSSYVTTDVPATTLALAALWLTLRFVGEGRPVHLALAFVASGLAVSTKYNTALVLLVPLTVLAIAAACSWAGYRRWLWGAAVVLPPLAVLAATPYALLDSATFLHDTTRMLTAYLEDPGTFAVAPGAPHLLLSLRLLLSHLGPFVAVGALGGLAALAPRREAWVVFPYGLAVLLATASTRMEFHRNLVQLYPLAAIAFGVAVAMLLGATRWPVLARAVAAVLLLGGIWEAASTSKIAWQMGRKPETRTVLVDRLNDSGPWRRVGIARELGVHPLDLVRLQASSVVAPMARLLCAQGTEDAIVLPAGFASPDPASAGVALDRALAALAGPAVLAMDRTRPVMVEGWPTVDPGWVIHRPVAAPAVLPPACVDALSANPPPREALRGLRERAGRVRGHRPR